MESSAMNEYLFIAIDFALIPFKAAFDVFLVFSPFYVLYLSVEYALRRRMFDEPHVRGLIAIWALLFFICAPMFNAAWRERQDLDYQKCSTSAFHAINSMLAFPLAILWSGFLVYMYLVATPPRVMRWAISIAAVAAFQTTCVIAGLLSPQPEALSPLLRASSIFAVLLMAFVGLIIGSFAGRTTYARHFETALVRGSTIQPRAAKVVLAACTLLYSSLKLLAFKHTNLDNLFLLLHFRRHPSALWTVASTLLLWGVGFLTLLNTVSGPRMRAGIATALLEYVVAIFLWPYTAPVDFKWENFDWKEFACGGNLSLQVLVMSYWVVVCASAVWSLIQHLVLPQEATASQTRPEEVKVPQDLKADVTAEPMPANGGEAV